MSETELVDEITLLRQKTGKILPRGEFFKQKKNFLAVHVWIKNSDNLFLMQKRVASKKVDSGLWSVCGGVVASGETSIEAAVRETEEEIGLRLNAENMYLLYQNPEPDPWGGMVDVWLAKTDVEIKNLSIQPKEVEKARWFSLLELQDFIRKGKVSPHIIFALFSILQV